MKITVETLVKAPVTKVWSAYTNPDDVTKWNYASDDWHCPRASGDPRVGGTFSWRMEAKDGSMGFDFEGVYTRIEELERLEYDFGGRAATVEFVPGANGVTVRVTFDAESEHPLEAQREGWQAILNNFAKHAEG